MRVAELFVLRWIPRLVSSISMKVDVLGRSECTLWSFPFKKRSGSCMRLLVLLGSVDQISCLKLMIVVIMSRMELHRSVLPFARDSHVWQPYVFAI